MLTRYCVSLVQFEKFDSMPKLMVEEDEKLVPFADLVVTTKTGTLEKLVWST
jgi:hypothetical protein